MLRKIPPPVFKYDIGNMPDMLRRIRKWSDYDQIPEIELQEVRVGPDTMQELPEAFASLGVRPGATILAVMDLVEMKRKDKQLKPEVTALLKKSGYNVISIVLEGDEYGIVHADFKEVEQVKAKLTPDMAVLSVGSGSITDIAKHACFLFEQEQNLPPLPLISVMTANTVGAYNSRSSIISKDRVKRTWPSRTPQILIMDLQILMDCPKPYTMAGAGDMLPVFCAFADWYLADCLGLGSFLDASWRIVDDIKDLLLPYMGEIAKGTALGMEVAGKCLLETGLTMTYARDSVPVSGYEHVISHMLDMTASADGRQTGIHGQQVGIASILSIIHLEKLIESLDAIAADRGAFSLDRCYPEPEKMREIVLNLFAEVDSTGAMGEECWRDYAVKLEGWTKAKPQFVSFLDNWPKHRDSLRELMPRTAPECTRALEILRHPLQFSELTYPIAEERGRWAFRNAIFMRKRFTGGDLAYFLGLADSAWEEDVFLRYQTLIQQARSN